MSNIFEPLPPPIRLHFPPSLPGTSKLKLQDIIPTSSTMAHIAKKDSNVWLSICFIRKVIYLYIIIIVYIR